MEFKKPHRDSEKQSESTESQLSSFVDTAHTFLRTNKKRIVIIVGIIIVVVCVIAAILVIRGQGNANNSNASSKPSFQTVLPSGKSIDQLGGWKRVSPPENDPVFAYADKIGNIPIGVSEQPLPKSFEGNTEAKVAELAKKFNATSELDANGTKFYVGTSAKGPQSAILAKNNLLIFIKTQKKVTDKAWVEYVTSLNETKPTDGKRFTPPVF